MTDTADVVVIGGGTAGTVAAIECAKLGLDVRMVVDPAEATAIRTISLGSVDGIDSGAEHFAPGDRIDELRQELGLEAETLRERNTLLDTGSVCAQLPPNLVAGIPGNPLAAELTPFVSSAKFRAYADRVMPFLKIGEAQNLGQLVRQRYGRAVLERFTNPWCQAVYGLSADEVDVHRAAPRLNSMLTSFGSLSGAALALSAEPEPQLRLSAGLQQLQIALTARAENYAVTFVSARATSLSRAEDHWLVGLPDGALRARAVIAAIDPNELGWDRLPGVEGTVQQIQLLTALIQTQRPAQATGLLTSIDPMLRSASRPAARSAALLSQLPEGHDIIRVVTGTEAVDAEAQIISAAERLGAQGVRVLEVDSQAHTVLRPWVGLSDPQPGEAFTDETGTLEWTGQWASGSGLARVASHAHDSAHRVRKIALDLRLAAHS